MAKKPRKITKDYLERAAFYYLSRYASGEGNLRYILENKIKRAEYSGSDIPSETTSWIDDVVAKCVRIGLASDTEYSKMKVRSLLAQGKSLRQIQMTLKQKRVKEEIIKETLSSLKDVDGEIDKKSALKYAKKRRFGPFRNTLRVNDGDEEGFIKKKREKELASMIRAGFSYNISTEILDGSGD